MSNFEFDYLLEKYIAGTCTPTEEQAVLKWYRQLISESAITISNEEKQTIETRIWNAIHQNIQPENNIAQPARIVPIQSRFWFKAVAAACVVLLVVMGTYWFANSKHSEQLVAKMKAPQGYIFCYNDGASIKKIQLSDSSVITLQPNTSLCYPQTFTGHTREVYLSGNAFFDVKHMADDHFIVHTDDGMTTEDLGTSFFIGQDKKMNTTKVEVVSGKVSVYEETKKETANSVVGSNSIILTPNQKVEYNVTNKHFTTSLVDNPLPQNSDAKNLIFEDAPIAKVLTTLSNTYGIEIIAASNKVLSCPFTGDISNTNLYKQMGMVCRVINASYEINGTRIIIKGNGCNQR